MADDSSDLDWRQPSRESANIARASADGAYLVVEYRSGHTYRYPGLADMLPSLINAESPGQWANRHLSRMKHVRLK